MLDDSIEAIYTYAERAYVRAQAGDVLIRCLEDASTAPMYQMVESLVLAGPGSLDTLREILAETALRRTQVDNDLQEILNGLITNLEGYGVRLHLLKKPATVASLRQANFLRMLRIQGVDDAEQPTCLQLLRDAKDLINSLMAHQRILADLESYLRDWMWGVCYQSFHIAPDTGASQVPNAMM